jgi:glycine betaine/choline ABC-type transport system substrate-binding protein
VKALLDKLSARLTTAQLSNLNVEVSEGVSPATAAERWVTAQHLA